jgi:hypothetical protein
MTETLNSYHSMYASLSAEITSLVGKISVLSREEDVDNSGKKKLSTLTFKTGWCWLGSEYISK